MTDFYYKNSNGRIIDLTKPPFIGEISNDLLSYNWNYTTQGQAVQKIVKFDKNMVKKKFHVILSGNTDRDYMSHIEQFLQLTDVDIDNLKMGRLYYGDYFLECYIIASKKPKRYVGTDKTMVECQIVCERGNWQSEHTFKFTPMGSGETPSTGYGFLYPYDYDYDYSAPYLANTILNESYMDTDFEMTFYGADELPEIVIGGNEYRVNYSLEAGDRLTINSKDKTVYVTKNNGQRVNVFMYRDKEWKIFEPIKSGGNVVLLDGLTTVDVTLFYERSEPKWSNEIWT